MSVTLEQLMSVLRPSNKLNKGIVTTEEALTLAISSTPSYLAVIKWKDKVDGTPVFMFVDGPGVELNILPREAILSVDPYPDNPFPGLTDSDTTIDGINRYIQKHYNEYRQIISIEELIALQARHHSV